MEGWLLHSNGATGLFMTLRMDKMSEYSSCIKDKWKYG